MSRSIPTTADMDAVLEFAKSRGLAAKHWDDQKRWLVITLPQVDTPPAEECAEDKTSTPNS